jgi:hypothetical protein
MSAPRTAALYMFSNAIVASSGADLCTALKVETLQVAVVSLENCYLKTDACEFYDVLNTDFPSTLCIQFGREWWPGVTIQKTNHTIVTVVEESQYASHGGWIALLLSVGRWRMATKKGSSWTGRTIMETILRRTAGL